MECLADIQARAAVSPADVDDAAAPDAHDAPAAAAADAAAAKRAKLEQEAMELEASGFPDRALQLRASAGLINQVSSEAQRVAKIKRDLLPSFTVREELQRYLALGPVALETDVYNWWAQHKAEFPTISRVAARLLAIPATSVPVERLFSKLKRLVSPQRASLAADTCAALMLINENAPLYPHCFAACSDK